jgi:hypothetical protein
LTRKRQILIMASNERSKKKTPRSRTKRRSNSNLV